MMRFHFQDPRKHFFLWLGSLIIFEVILFLLNEDISALSGVEVVILVSVTVLLLVISGSINFIILITILGQIFRAKYRKYRAFCVWLLSIFGLFAFAGILIVSPFAINSYIQKYKYEHNDISNSVGTKNVVPSRYILISSELNPGDRGSDVGLLQFLLSKDKTIYPEGVVSGYYGKLTERAVRNFQSKYSLPVTGKVDSTTLSKISEVYGTNSRDYYLALIDAQRVIRQSAVNNRESREVDPLVYCNVNAKCGGGTKLITKSVCEKSTCCQIGDKWIFYGNEEDCVKDQNDYYKRFSDYSKSNENYENIYKPLAKNEYYTCTLYYPSLNLYQTYDYLYKTEADCLNAQELLNNSVSEYPSYDSYSEPEVDTDYPIGETPQQTQITKAQCQQIVNDKYRSKMISYGCSYPCPETGDCGGTSVCSSIWSEVQKEMSKCDQYP